MQTSAYNVVLQVVFHLIDIKKISDIIEFAICIDLYFKEN